MSNYKKKKFPKSIFASNAAGCGGCGKPKLSDIVQPDAKPSSHNTKPRSSSSSSGHRNGALSLEDEDCTSSTTTISLKSTGLLSPPPATTIGDSIAVEKNSDDPYEDFRDSMLHMIIEKKIYSTAGLQELLNCFLHLNSPFHHEIIVKAFTEIWDEFVFHSLQISDNSELKPPSAGEG